MLKAQDLACVRGERCLFRGVAFELAPGQCLHVAGDNGAGKTSLLRMLAGLLPPTEGAVLWRGRALGAAREEFGAELAYVGHANGIKDELTVLENVRFEAAVRGADASVSAALAALDVVGMGACAGLLVRHLSQGQRRRTALARLCGPAPAPAWILDEPFDALDARTTARLLGHIGAHLAGGGIVVLTAHQAIDLPPHARRLELRDGARA